MSGALPPGVIQLRGVTRSFKVFQDRKTTVKERFVRRSRDTYIEKYALREADLTISAGERVGIVGRNGSGKSTLLKMIAGIIPPQSGDLAVGGEVASMLELGSGFHPDFTGRENIYLNGAIQGIPKDDLDQRLNEILAFAEIGPYIDMPLRTYSSGMQLRLAFAVAANVWPDVLLLDEVLAVGDERFQKKCKGRIGQLTESGVTLCFVSHDAESVMEICSRAILIEEGTIIADGAPEIVMPAYRRLLNEPRSGVADELGEGAANVEHPQKSRGLGPLGGVGQGRIAFDRVWVANGDDVEVSVLQSGEGMVIHADVNVREMLDEPIVFGFRVHQSSGVALCEGESTATEVSGPGPHHVSFHVAGLPFGEGWFEVALWIRTQDESLEHLADPAVGFQVSCEDDGFLGPVRLAGFWALPGVQPSSGASNATPESSGLIARD